MTNLSPSTNDAAQFRDAADVHQRALEPAPAGVALRHQVGAAGEHRGAAGLASRPACSSRVGARWRAAHVRPLGRAAPR
ncbi:MAG: hypothetical protein M5R42_17530 [Rhodocyclaceae bacterium]|nr:hypothetical protein [Rhodocyclaceae bacterium]